MAPSRISGSGSGGLDSAGHFVVSLFQDGVNVYEAHNNGGWYNFGFLWAAAIVLGGGGSAASQAA